MSELWEENTDKVLDPFEYVEANSKDLQRQENDLHALKGGRRKELPAMTMYWCMMFTLTVVSRFRDLREHWNISSDSSESITRILIFDSYQLKI